MNEMDNIIGVSEEGRFLQQMERLDWALKSSFPGGSKGRVCLQYRRPGFNP